MFHYYFDYEIMFESYPNFYTWIELHNHLYFLSFKINRRNHYHAHKIKHLQIWKFECCWRWTSRLWEMARSSLKVHIILLEKIDEYRIYLKGNKNKLINDINMYIALLNRWAMFMGGPCDNLEIEASTCHHPRLYIEFEGRATNPGRCITYKMVHFSRTK